STVEAVSDRPWISRRRCLYEAEIELMSTAAVSEPSRLSESMTTFGVGIACLWSRRAATPAEPAAAASPNAWVDGAVASNTAIVASVATKVAAAPAPFVVERVTAGVPAEADDEAASGKPKSSIGGVAPVFVVLPNAPTTRDVPASAPW